MISFTTSEQISAGILVEKSREQHLTKALHCWAKELNTKPEKFRDPEYFILIQGQMHIRYLVECINTTDIRFVTLKKDIVFSNCFLDILTLPKLLRTLLQPTTWLVTWLTKLPIADIATDRLTGTD